MTIKLLSVVLLLSIIAFAKTSIQSTSDGTSGTINFGGPADLNSEESSSFHMPNTLKCDGCQIIAHLFFEAFHKAESRLPSSQKLLTESQIIDVVENVCSSDFDQYGITDFGGQKRLKGPGLDTEGMPGVTQSGGKWPMRLQQMCNLYVGELDEDFLYRKYRRSVDTKSGEQYFRKYVCEQSGNGLAHCRKERKEL